MIWIKVAKELRSYTSELSPVKILNLMKNDGKEKVGQENFPDQQEGWESYSLMPASLRNWAAGLGSRKACVLCVAIRSKEDTYPASEISGTQGVRRV